jgi:hypothetical protein
MRKFLLPAVLFILVGVTAKAQNFQNAGEYISYINKTNESLSVKYLTYLSAVSHGKSARKVEKKRQEVVNSISEARVTIAGMPSFKGDRTVKDTSIAYIKILYNVFNEDYGKIVNMEEIAEQSYDAMEAYLLAQEKAQEKLEQASEKQQQVVRRFAAAHNVNLIETESDISTKMKVADKVENHYHEVYLVFFKCYKQEAYLLDAAQKKNLLSIEQNLNSLQKFIDEGNQKLDTMNGYNNDASLIQAGRQSLEFYKMEAGKGTTITDFFLKQENFTKTKKLFDSKPAARRTQQDVDQYNKAVNDINGAVNTYNSLNQDLDKQRQKMLDNWNNTVKHYLDTYVPVQRG